MSLTFQGYSLYPLIEESYPKETEDEAEEEEFIVQNELKHDIMDYCNNDFPTCRTVDNIDDVVNSLNKTHKLFKDFNIYNSKQFEKTKCSLLNETCYPTVNEQEIKILNRSENSIKQLREFAELICLEHYHHLVEIDVNMEAHIRSAHGLDDLTVKGLAER